MGSCDFILTYDLGTTGNKCTVFDREGHALYSAVVPYGCFYPKPGWAEQDPNDFWESIVAGTRLLREQWDLEPGDIAAIGLSGTMNGCIPVGPSGEVLYRNIIHSDCRGAAMCDYISSHIPPDEFYRITGNRLDSHYTLPKVLWLKENHPDIYEKARYFINTKDYAAYRLTGRLGITDYSDASLTCMLDMQKKAWAAGMLVELGLDEGKLPDVKRSIEIAGPLCREAAEALGLIEGIPVSVGGGDGACATHGAGLAAPGRAYNYLGSSSWICTLSAAPVIDEKARIFNFYDLDGFHCNVCGTVQSAAASYNWALDMLAQAPDFMSHDTESTEKKEKTDIKAVYDWVEREAGKSPPGANGIIFLPYLMGERTPYWDENARGAFVGFSLFHKRSDMLRAVYEGVAFALKDVLDVFLGNSLTVEDLILIGGGAKSGLWRKILCDVYGRPVKVHKYPGEATSLGAAMAAGTAVGLYMDLAHACDTAYDCMLTPDDVTSMAYVKPYDIFKSLYYHLKPAYDALAAK